MKQTTPEHGAKAAMKSEENQIKQLTCSFVMCPAPLLQLQHKVLSPHALKLWLVIKSHAIDSSVAFPGIKRLAGILGVTRPTVFDLISELESRGLLKVTRQTGRVNQYQLRSPTDPDERLGTSPTSQADLTSQAQLTGQVELTNQSSGVDGGGQVELTLIRRTKVEEVNQNGQPSAEASPSVSEKVASKAKNSQQKSKKQKPLPPKEPGEIRQLLDAIDLEPHRAKAAKKGVNFDAVWEAFQENSLNGTPQDPTPNPRDYISFSLGLHSWINYRADHPEKFAGQPLDTPVRAAHRRFE